MKSDFGKFNENHKSVSIFVECFDMTEKLFYSSIPTNQLETCFYVRTQLYTEKTILLFPFKLNGIWSWWQFSFIFETSGIPFGSKLKGKLSPRSYPIQFERKCNYSFLSVTGRYNCCHLNCCLIIHFHYGFTSNNVDYIFFWIIFQFGAPMKSWQDRLYTYSEKRVFGLNSSKRCSIL